VSDRQWERKKTKVIDWILRLFAKSSR